MNTTTIIPILSRYFNETNSTNNCVRFAGAVKATAAFLALYRSYFGDTRGVDEAFRKVLSDYKLKATTNFKKEPLDVDELKSAFRLLWEEKIKNEASSKTKSVKDQWISRVVRVPLYTKSQTLCKFMLFVSNYKTTHREDGVHLLKTGARGNEQFLDVSVWDELSYSTLEHVAPQNPKRPSSWDDSIYEEEISDTIGNLLLMPQRENSMVGNKNWIDKKKYYQLYSIMDFDEIEEAVKNSGLNLKADTINLMKKDKCLPILKPISEIKTWDATIIKERSESIAGHVYNHLSRWLGLP